MKTNLNSLFRLFLVLSCLLAGCSSVTSPVSGSTAPLPQPNNPASQPQKVALLLPLEGQYGASAQAIRNGFLAAYYADKQQNPNVPTVTVLDTSDSSATSVYNQAINNGATFVVGPLTKLQVQSIASEGDLKVPTLALNSLDSKQRIPGNLFFYSLSPRDEAIQAADKARQDGHSRAIVIVPASAWGQTVAHAFNSTWRSSGGQIAGTLAFTWKQDLTGAIGNLLQVDKSTLSSKGFHDALKSNVPLSQMRRQDFDVVFIAASPQQARLIKPILKFYFAGNIPVYATSSVYSGTPSPNSDRDLNGIIFGDMPWVLNAELPANSSTVKARIASLWPDSYASYSKLYAMGVDSYALINGLSHLTSSSQATLRGATGTLYLDSGHEIHRHLEWAKFQNGVPAVL